MDAWVTPAEIASLAAGRVDGCGDLTVAAAAASETLYRLSGERFGVFSSVARPCIRRGCVPREAGWLAQTDWTGFYWRGPDGPQCSCRPAGSVLLEGAPVVAVDSVTVGGTVLVDGVDYRRVGRVLYPLLGGFPACQDLSAPAGSTGAFAVAYRWGTPVPPGGRIAAAELATEIARSLVGKECRLPASATQVTRSGVTISRVAHQGARFGAISTLVGVPAVDAWLRGVNPQGIRRAARLSSPAYP